MLFLVDTEKDALLARIYIDFGISWNSLLPLLTRKHGAICTEPIHILPPTIPGRELCMVIAKRQHHQGVHEPALNCTLHLTTAAATRGDDDDDDDDDNTAVQI